MLNEKLLKAIFDCYSDVDRSHGQIHIQQCLANCKIGYHQVPFEKVYTDFLSEDFVALCVALHDIGLSEQMCRESEIKGDIKSAVWRREKHHENSANIFDIISQYAFFTDGHVDKYDRKFRPHIAALIEAGFEDIVFNETLQMIGSHAILHHRASVSQYSLLDSFLRTCDGLNTAEQIIQRHVIHHIRMLDIEHFDDVFSSSKTHIEKKYTGNDAYAKKLPLGWGQEIYEKEIERLKSMTEDEMKTLAKKFYDEEMSFEILNT